MGGAIGGIAAAWEPDWFHKVILSSPMIRPLTDNVPWPAATGIALEKCIFGKDEEYVAGRKPYDAAVLLRQAPQHQNQDTSDTKISVQNIRSSRPGLHPTAGSGLLRK